MALNRYVVTADTILPAGTATAVAGGQGNTVSWSGTGGLAPTLRRGQVLMLDPAGALYTAIGAGNLRPWVDGQDTVGHAGLSN